MIPPGAIAYMIKWIDRDFDSKEFNDVDAQKFLDNIRSWGVPELTVHANERQRDLDSQIENEKVKEERV